MPRGGRRPGAGALKGNFNAARTGKHSRRVLLTYLRLLEYLANEDKDALMREACLAGFCPPPKHRFNGDNRGLVEWLYRKWFVNPVAEQSTTINNNQPEAPAAPATEAPAPTSDSDHQEVPADEP